MKKVGISRFDTSSTQTTSYSHLSTTLTTTRAAQLETQFNLFKEILLSSSNELMTSSKHRAKFLALCAKIGINPLALYDKKENFKEFYNLLCLKLIEFWNEMRGLNGGLVSVIAFEKKYCGVEETLRRDGIAGEIGVVLTEEDWDVVLGLLRVLNPGVVMLELGKQGGKFISFDDQGLVSSGEENHVLGVIMTKGCVSENEILGDINSSDEDELIEFRAKEILNRLVMKGYVWIDIFQGITTYWDPSLMGI